MSLLTKWTRLILLSRQSRGLTDPSVPTAAAHYAVQRIPGANLSRLDLDGNVLWSRIIDPLYPMADAPMSPTTDFVIHVLIVSAEVAALVVVYRLARHEDATPAPQLEGV